jgi:predicted RNase H-like nuclease
MASYLGVDWAGGCWVVAKAGDETYVTTEPAFFNVWHEHGRDDDIQSMLVDIPIGLPDEGTRACDREAKERLGASGMSAFQIPRREVVEMDGYCEARAANHGSLSSQSWWLFPRHSRSRCVPPRPRRRLVEGLREPSRTLLQRTC